MNPPFVKVIMFSLCWKPLQRVIDSVVWLFQRMQFGVLLDCIALYSGVCYPAYPIILEQTKSQKHLSMSTKTEYFNLQGPICSSSVTLDYFQFSLMYLIKWQLNAHSLLSLGKCCINMVQYVEVIRKRFKADQILHVHSFLFHTFMEMFFCCSVLLSWPGLERDYNVLSCSDGSVCGVSFKECILAV